MAEKPPKTFYDFIAAFDAGVNSGIEPLLLPRNQLAFGVNTSVRGAYVTHRPPLQIQTLNYVDPASQAIVETGLFQGGGYYRSDYGGQTLIAQISGHLFQFAIVGNAWNVTDISVPGDLNSATAQQAWMWQSEKWLIVNDGTGVLPIFFDGVTSRRSYGPTVTLGTVASGANFPSPRVIGEIITVVLGANYTGPFNAPVIYNGEYYQSVPSPLGTNDVVLTNIDAAPGSTTPIGSMLIFHPGFVGTVVTGGTDNSAGGNFTPPQPRNISVIFNSVTGLAVGTVLMISNPTPFGALVGFEVMTIDPVTKAVLLHLIGFTFAQGNPPTTIANGQFAIETTAQPNFPIGNTTAPFVVPAIGGTVVVSIDQPYTGPGNQVVWIGTEKYIINPPPPLGASTTLYLMNLSDTSDAGAAIPVGSPTGDIFSVPELPAGRMGAYGMGRNAMSLIDGISWIYGDIVGGAAGTAAYNYRDSVLKTSENTFLFGSGNFRLPGTGEFITAMVFSANLDASLGQGPLQVGTTLSIFTCTVGFDRSLWPATNNPILTQALIGKGPTGQNSTKVVNSDTLFRSDEGEASLILARREFNSFGNVPISQEMKRIIEKDYQPLLPFGSAATFDNRFLFTAAPNISGQGVYHIGMLVMNFDTVSNLRTKLPPVYDGFWKGINVLQIISGVINGSKRAFAFSLNTTTSKIELYEFLPEATTQTQDNGNAPIVWTFETPILFNKDVKPLTELVKLLNGEIYLKDIVGTVEIEVEYRPDFYPCWTPWRKFKVCANADQTVTDSQPGYRCSIGLGEPDGSPCEAGNNRPLRTGYFYQCRVTITGSCKWMGMRAAAVAEPGPVFAPPICDEVCP